VYDVVTAEGSPRRRLSTDHEQRQRRIARMLWRILWLNLIVALAKLIYGFQSGAIAITADGLHSLMDASSNVLGLVGVSVARRPPDDNHPYGHRKYETFAALGIAAMLFLGCWEILSAAVERLRHPVTPAIGAGGFAVMLATLAVNLAVVRAERREGRRLNSELLLADAAHTWSDAFASLLVLASFVALKFGLGWADVAAAGLIVVIILRAGFGILRNTLSTLSDERRIQPGLIEQVALEEPGVMEAHNVRSRGPADDIHVDLHVLVHPDTRLAEAHRIGHRVEQRLRERWRGLTDVVVHVEPAIESERARVREGGGLKAEG
jgi:cation diffusion facilitator family transporter